MGIINNLINSLKDNFTMAEFNINGRMTVKSLRKQFKDAFGATLRVYKGAKFAPEDATLASIRSGESAKGGELACKGNLQVGNFEAKMKEMFGIIAAAGREAVATDDWSNEQLQCYFWDTLQDLLITKGYDIQKKDFSHDVEDYYKSTRYKRYGVTFNIYKTKKKKDITFTIYTIEKYCFGVKYAGDVATDKVLEDAIGGAGTAIRVADKTWAGWGEPSPRNELNFKKMNSEGIGKLKNPTARAAFMGSVVNEIDSLIKNLVEAFKKKGL